MKMLKIVNHHRQPLAQITWTPDNQLQLEILEAETDADFKSALTDFVNNCQHQGAYLWGTNLDGACLEGTNLTGASLRNAKLNGVDLQNAILHGATMPDGRVY